jgi:carbonic anhydrase
MSFCTVVNCMDGRVQLPVIEFLKKRFQADYVDCATEDCPAHILAGETNRRQIQSILDRIDVSIARHQSKAVAVVAHHDCAANPADKQKQLEQLDISVKYLKGQYPAVEVIGLWVDDNWSVSEVPAT